MSIRLSRRSRKTADPGSDVTTPARRGRLSYANVTASLALFVALGGTSYAAIKLPAKSVGTVQLKSRAVTKAKIAPGAVDGSRVRNGSLKTADLAAGAADGSKVRDGSLTGADLAAGAVDGSKVRDGSLTSADIAGKVAAAVIADGLASVQRVAVPGTSEAAAPGGFTNRTATATCPAGTFVVGGGASLNDRTVQSLDDSFPSSATAWTTNIVNDGETAPGFTVFAICVPAVAGS
ncbi:MAG: hypothetical protein QOJ63_667 [Solirubrobacteraceae bacterium]|jgi:hypothetical protein|nr:hypothetical protein [Solirubrobacteraceae bacterium]